ncbi:MAG TPA: MFS transporter [Gemmatimonadales bacterium]|nr:MFS transporter [Gemmatimonadales bacterium]
MPQTPPDSPPEIPRHDSYAALRIPAFRWFIAAVVTQTLASQMQAVVVGWQVYEITRSPLSLGLIGLAEAIPFIGTVLLAGHWADRSDRKRLAVLATGLLWICAAALLWLTLGHESARLKLTLIYVVVFVSGLARALLMPARTALAGDIVPREALVNSVSWRSSSWQLAAVIGPAIGGGLYALSGPALAYEVGIVLLAAGTIAYMKVPAVSMKAAATTEPLKQALGQGIGFVRSQPIFLGAITLDLFAVLFGGAEALLPIFAADILNVGPEGLGILRAAHSAGAVAMSLYLSHRAPLQRPGRALLYAVGGFGLCMIGFGVSKVFLLSFGLLFCAGMLDNVSVLIRSSLLQTLTPAHLLGRVSAVNSIFIGSSNEIGAFESGVAASLMGTVPSVVFGGTMTLIVVLLTAWRVPELRRLGQIR